MLLRVSPALLVLVSLSAPALASPTEKSCGRDIASPANSNGFHWDTDCQTVHVLPPEKGRVSLDQMAGNVYLERCPAVHSGTATMNNTMESMKIISQHLLELTQNYKPLQEEALQLQKDSVLKKAEKDTAADALTRGNKKKEELFQAIVTAKKDFNECSILATTPATECKVEADALQDAKLSYKNFLTGEYKAIEDRAMNAENDFRIASGKALEYGERLARSIEPLMKLQAEANNLRISASTIVDEYVKLPGAKGTVAYEVNSAELVDSFRNLNPGLIFKPISIKKATFTAGITLPSGAETVAAPVLWTYIPGIGASGAKALPEGQSIPALSPFPTDISVPFNGGMTGQVQLSLAGSCHFYKDASGFPTTISQQEFTTHIAATMQYEYEIALKRGYDAKYHMGQFIKRVETQSKKGGLFSTRTLHEIVEDKQSTDWFDMKPLEGGGSEYQYSDEEWNQLSRDVKAGLIDRAITQFAMLSGGPSQHPTLPQIAPSGAAVAADGLRKCPHLYCQGGALVLGVLDSIFGRSSATSSFQSSNNIWVSERVEGVKYVPRAGTTAFTLN
jgi:hypothetical protein